MTIAYEATGSGDPLVLIHGITEQRRSWDPLVPALAEDHTVVLVDLPGHGASGPGESYDVVSLARAVAGVVDELEVPVPLVVGHSLGGAVATAYAAAHPCRAVVNVDQPLDLAGFQAALRELEPMLRGDKASFEAAIDAVFSAMAGELSGPERDRLEALREPRQDVVLAIWGPVLEQTAGELDALVRSLGAAVQVPYRAIHGIDPGSTYATWLAEVIPGANLEVWDGVGHYPHLVHPQRFLERLRAFEAGLS